MRILMISALEVWALTGGGGARSLYETLQGYTRRGHEIDFVGVTIGANHQHGAPELQPPEIDNVRFHLFHLPSLQDLGVRLPSAIEKMDQKLRFALLFPWLASREALKVARNNRVDLLYGYEVHGILAQRLVRRKFRLPLVARFQGTVMHPYLGSPLSLARKFEETLALQTSAELYVMTDDGTQGDEVLARLNPGSVGRVRFWRNGLDLMLLRPPSDQEASEARQGLGIKRGAFVLVTATRLARWKRIDRAIDAVALLRDRGMEVRLIVVGDGEERDNLEQQARSLGLGDRVEFAGAVPQSEVQRYLWAGDVFICVNELSNVGNPLLEAMLSGRCILTLDEGDTRDLIKDGETGVLLGSGQPAVIADAIEALIGDADRRRWLAAGARAFAEANFWSWQQRLDAEVDAVEALISSREPISGDA
jgi:glycosyltransferase involved in cell wall biosynthesis